MGNRSAPPKLGRGGRPCKAIPDILLSHGRNPEQPKSSGSSVSLLAQPTPCSHSTGPPRPSKTFPFSLYLSSPFNSILESPFWPADGPSILPLISPESTYSQLCPELRGPLHHPLPEREAPRLPPPGAGNNLQPPLLPTPPWSQDPSAWACRVAPVLWWDQCSRNSGLPGVQMPLDVAPIRSLSPRSRGWWPCGHRCCDSSVASWAAFLPGRAG